MCLLSSQQVNIKLNVKCYYRYRSVISIVNAIQQVAMAEGNVTQPQLQLPKTSQTVSLFCYFATD